MISPYGKCATTVNTQSVYKTSDEALHGYGVARRIEQISNDLLKLNEGTVYASLTRLQHQRWISASWGTSENNRKAKFYAISKAGRRQLAKETEHWKRMAGVIARLLCTAEQP